MHRDDEDLELWGRDMDREDWMRGSYGSGSMPRRGGEPTPRFGSRGRGWGRGPDWNRGSDWNRGPDWNPGPDWGRGPSWNRGPSWTAGWERQPGWQQRDWDDGGDYAYGPEPWRGDRDWSQESWRQRQHGPWGHDFAPDWSGGDNRHWHGRTTARGYQRSDERIREDVYERLMEHPAIDTSEIDISVSHGEVTLEGSVDDRWEKRLAEDLAESVSGVTDVHNRLRFSHPAQPSRPGSGTTSFAPARMSSASSSPSSSSPSSASPSSSGGGWAAGPGATPPTAGQTQTRSSELMGSSPNGT